MRRTYQAQPAARGSALGRARVVHTHPLQIREERIRERDVPDELARLRAAIGVVRGEMAALREKLQDTLTKEVRDLIDVHTLVLDDPELLRGLKSLVQDELCSADYALRLQRDRIADAFAAMDDAYLRGRMEDIDQVILRIHSALHQRDAEVAGAAGDILVTPSVAPADLARLPSQGVLGIVTIAGSAYSHSAILARSLHLPMVSGSAEALADINDGDVLIVDGDTGTIVVEPSAADLRQHRVKAREEQRERKALQKLRRERTRTRDGQDIELWINAETREDIATGHMLGANGVGLYRTEFLFLQRDEVPSEEEQFLAYRDAVLGMAGRPVTIRTLDIGADKADRTGLALSGEPNPALGVRGIRLSLRRPDLFDEQLRAILRASAYGPVRILLPMVSGREEIKSVRMRVKRLHAELSQTHTAIRELVPLGAMIEVPSAALSMSRWIGLVDFVSIGTNDLVQYLLAADRGNDALDDLYTPLHPAVLRVLADIIRTARLRGRPVAMCGEFAADPIYAPLLLTLGLEQFSMHPSSLLEVRKAVRASDYEARRAMLPHLLRLQDRAAIEQWMRDNSPAG